MADEPNMLQTMVTDVVNQKDLSGALRDAAGPVKGPSASLESLDEKARQGAQDTLESMRTFEEGLPCANEFRGEEGARNKPNAKARKLLTGFSEEIQKSWKDVQAEIATVKTFKAPVAAKADTQFCAKGAPGLSVMGQYSAETQAATNFFGLKSESVGALAYKIAPFYKEGDPGVKNDNYLRDRFKKAFDAPRRAPGCKEGYDQRMNKVIDAIQKYGSAVHDYNRSYLTPLFNVYQQQRRTADNLLEDCRAFAK